MSDWTIIRRSLQARPVSTVLTVLTVAVAVGLMVVIASLREATQEAFEQGGGNMHLLISAEADPLTAVLNGVFLMRPPRRALEWAQYERLVEGFPVEYAIPLAQGDSYRGFPVVATTGEFFARFRPSPAGAWRLRQGRFLVDDFEVVAGAEAARGADLRLGQRIVLTHGTPESRRPPAHEHHRFAFEVVGILARTGTPFDRALFITLDSAWIVHAQDRLEREIPQPDTAPSEEDDGHEHASVATRADLTDADRKITGVYLRLATRPGSDVSAAEPAVFSRLRAEPGLTVAKPADEVRRLFAIIAHVDWVLAGMGWVVLAAGAAGILLALYNSMDLRRRQVAVLRVLGASRWRVFGLVLTESALLGMLGAAAGLLLALGGNLIVAEALRRTLGLAIHPVPAPAAVVSVALAAVLLACAAGLLPASLAYRTSVARNLRPVA